MTKWSFPVISPVFKITFWVSPRHKGLSKKRKKERKNNLLAIVLFLSNTCGKISWKNCLSLLSQILPLTVVYFFLFENWCITYVQKGAQMLSELSQNKRTILPPLGCSTRPWTPFLITNISFLLKVTIICLLTAKLY